MTSRGVQGEWNFGPNHRERHTVAEVIDTFSGFYGVPGSPWTFDGGSHPKESDFLLLDSSKARSQLGWTDQLDFQQTLEWTATWYRNFLKLGAREATMSQINLFLGLK
jgi:CDP-glucose 4,6-dehydratase